MRYVALLTLGLLVACSGASTDAVSQPSPSPSSSSNVQDKATGGGSCGPVTAEQCKPAFHVATAAEVISATRAFDYQRVSISKGGALEIGDDVVADADIEVLASDLGPAGSDCQPDKDCHAPVFRTQGFPSFKTVAGITCLEKGDQPVRQAYACEHIAIAKGTTFRLRAVIEDVHPSAPNYWAFIDLLEPCAMSCGAGEVLCPSSHTCYDAGYASCSFCEGKTPEVCACRSNDCAQLPDGSECSFSSSPDVLESGVCRPTGCVRKR